MRHFLLAILYKLDYRDRDFSTMGFNLLEMTLEINIFSRSKGMKGRTHISIILTREVA